MLEESIRRYRKAIKIKPNCTHSLFKLAQIYEEQKKWQEASKFYQTLAKTFKKNKQIDKAIATYEKVITLPQPPVNAYRALADVLKDSNQLDKAVSAYYRSIQSEPDNPLCYLGLGLTLLTQQKWQSAVANLRKAIIRHPSRRIIYEIVNHIGDLPKEYLEELTISDDNFDYVEINQIEEKVNLPQSVTIPQGDIPRFAQETYINPTQRVFSIDSIDSYSKISQLFFVCQHGAPPYNNYYHWMFQIIPQINLWQRSMINRGDIGKIVFPFYLQSSFQRETLSTIGVSQFRVLELAEDNLKEPRNSLLFASSLRGNPRKWVCELLKSQFITNDFDIPSEFERIYICRNKASYRQIINHGEFNSFLESHGFKSINLESLSVKEQAALFAQSKVVLSPHGAGLTNIVFCRPHTKIIEIFSKSSTPRMYRKISHYCELEYYYLLCEEVDNALTKKDSQLKHLKDMIVNLDHLSKLMTISRAI